MGRARYANNQRWCKRGEHYVILDNLVKSKKGGILLCPVHRCRVRTYPKRKPYRTKFMSSHSETTPKTRKNAANGVKAA